MQLTLQDLIDRTYARLDNNQALYTRQEVIACINEAVKTLNLIVGFQQISKVLTTQSRRIWYNIPNEIVFPLRVKIENTYLQPSSMLSIGRTHPQWVTENTYNTQSQVSSWVRFGFRKIAIHPADFSGGKQLTITGVAEPPLLVAPSDTIQFSNDIMSAFDLYTSSTICLKESSKEFSMQSSAYQDFLRLAKRLTVWKSWVAPRYYINEATQPLNR